MKIFVPDITRPTGNGEYFQNRTVNVNGSCGTLPRLAYMFNLRLWKAREQLSCGVRRECFTTKKKPLHARQHRVDKLIFDETHLCKRRVETQVSRRNRQCA